MSFGTNFAPRPSSLRGCDCFLVPSQPANSLVWALVSQLVWRVLLPSWLAWDEIPYEMGGWVKAKPVAVGEDTLIRVRDSFLCRSVRRVTRRLARQESRQILILSSLHQPQLL